MNDEHPTLPYPEPSSEHPTLVIPPGADAQPPAKRRRRWPWVVLVILVVVAALVVAAELIARALLPGIVRGIVIEQLDLPQDQQLDVGASGILLPQLIGGSLDELHLSSESITFGGITAAVNATATGVPLRGGDLADAYGTVRIAEDQFTTLVAASDLPIDDVAFAAPNVTASASFDILGMAVPIALTVTPGADAGALQLTPVDLQIAGMTLNAADIAERFGDIAADFTKPQSICIANHLPAGLTVTGLKIEGTLAVIDVDVDGGIVTDEALQRNGVCD